LARPKAGELELAFGWSPAIDQPKKKKVEKIKYKKKKVETK